jgi:hypothetical protein
MLAMARVTPVSVEWQEQWRRREEEAGLGRLQPRPTQAKRREKGGRERAAGLRPQLGHQRGWIGQRERESKGDFLLFYFLKGN